MFFFFWIIAQRVCKSNKPSDKTTKMNKNGFDKMERQHRSVYSLFLVWMQTILCTICCIYHSYNMTWERTAWIGIRVNVFVRAFIVDRNCQMASHLTILSMKWYHHIHEIDRSCLMYGEPYNKSVNSNAFFLPSYLALIKIRISCELSSVVLAILSI